MRTVYVLMVVSCMVYAVASSQNTVASSKKDTTLGVENIQKMIIANKDSSISTLKKIKELREQQMAKFGEMPLKIDSVNTGKARMTVYKDSAGALYQIVKVSEDGTLYNAVGARYVNITDGDLTESQLQYLTQESVALAWELKASMKRAKARKEIR